MKYKAVDVSEDKAEIINEHGAVVAHVYDDDLCRCIVHNTLKGSHMTEQQEAVLNSWLAQIAKDNGEISRSLLGILDLWERTEARRQKMEHAIRLGAWTSVMTFIVLVLSLIFAPEAHGQDDVMYQIEHPKPCAVWIADFGTPIDEVTALAKAAGYKPALDSALTTNKGLKLRTYTHPSREVYVSFIYGEDKRVTMISVYMEYATQMAAQQAIESMQRYACLYWNNCDGKGPYRATCAETKTDAMLTFSRKGAVVSIGIVDVASLE